MNKNNTKFLGIGIAVVLVGLALVNRDFLVGLSTTALVNQFKVTTRSVQTFKITKTSQDFNSASNFEVGLATLSNKAEILSVQAVVTKRFIFPDDSSPDGFVVFVRGTNQSGDTCGLASKPAAVINPALEEFSQPGLFPTFCSPNFEKEIFVGNFAGTTSQATQGEIDFYVSYIEH